METAQEFTPSVDTTFFPRLDTPSRKYVGFRWRHRFDLGRVFQPTDQSPVVEH